MFIPIQTQVTTLKGSKKNLDVLKIVSSFYGFLIHPYIYSQHDSVTLNDHKNEGVTLLQLYNFELASSRLVAKISYISCLWIYI